MSPSPEHEALHRIFQHDPALFTRSISRILGIPVPEPSDVSVLNVDLTEIRPIERRADSVLQVEFVVESSASTYILLVESQTDREGPRPTRSPPGFARSSARRAAPRVEPRARPSPS